MTIRLKFEGVQSMKYSYKDIFLVHFIKFLENGIQDY